MYFYSKRDHLLKLVSDYNRLPKKRRDKYYRFRLSDNEIQTLNKNRELLKKYDLNLSDVVRHFALNCVDFDLLYSLGLIVQYDRKSNKKIIKYLTRPK